MIIFQWLLKKWKWVAGSIGLLGMLLWAYIKGREIVNQNISTEVKKNVDNFEKTTEAIEHDPTLSDHDRLLKLADQINKSGSAT